ncbi:hypothetical protein GYH30_026864 [Glycine max]|uniref:Uncharacterized protein n=1 Tax=Glycine soja TaxID=3848 RepID=A0A445IHD6_GLYSO|nr:hypothetical protein GYH30_026864 [Glycine max]RZB85533.1 hypothetical protein D0Y65_025909 [Glycine soja]
MCRQRRNLCLTIGYRISEYVSYINRLKILNYLLKVVIFSDICRVNRLCEGKIVRPILVSDTREKKLPILGHFATIQGL